MTRSAETAKAIKAELKKTFPNTKFSVKSENYAGGNSVNIHWFDGANLDEVECIVAKYKQGHFNGMEDIYEYSNSRDDIPQAKYIFVKRHYTKTVMESAVNEICKEWGVETLEVKVSDYDNSSFMNYTYDQFTESLIRKIQDKLGATNY